MKSKLAIAAVLAALVTACSPEVYRVNLEVRQPSKSGLDLHGKSIGIVYEEGLTQDDALFSSQAASAFARELESDYFGSKEVIGLYTIPAQDSITVSTMRDLVMDTGEDVIFLINSSVLERNPDGSIPFMMELYAYDSMGEDKLNKFHGQTALKSLDQANADSIAKRMSPRFKSVWKAESFSFYWFDDIYADKWFDAIDKIEQGEFVKAISVWEQFVKSSNKQKAACASYNIALGFYLLGDMQLATRWLDAAEGIENVTLAQGLRKRIASHLEK